MRSRSSYWSILFLLIFTLSLDQTVLTFGSFDPGGAVDLTDAQVATVQSDEILPWFLKTSIASEQSGVAMSIRTAGGSGGGTPSFMLLSTTNQNIYASGAGEESNFPAGTAITLSYRLTASSSALSGGRSWTIQYTLSQTL